MKKELLIYLAGRFIPAVVNIAVIILAIRYIGAEGYGRYSLLMSLVLIAVTLTYHWIQVSILRFLGAMPKDSEVVIGRFFDMTVISSVLATVLVTGLTYWYFNAGIWELVLIAIVTLLTHFYLYHQAILQAFHRSFRSALLEGADQLIILTALLTGLFFFGIGDSALLIGSLAAGLAGALMLRFFIRVKGLHTMNIRQFYWDTRFSGRVMEFGFGVALWLLFSQLLTAADRLIIYEHFGFRETGVYSAIKDLIYKGVTFSIFPIYTSYQNKIGDEWNANHKLQTWAKVKEAVSFELLIFTVIFLGFMMIKTVLFRDILLIPELDNWLIYLPVLLAAFLWQVVLLFQRFLDLTIRSRYVLWLMGITLVVNLLLNILFLPVFGLPAASFSLLIAAVIYIGFIFFRCLLVCRNLD